MSGPSTKASPRPVNWAPHPDDLEEVRAGLEEAERGKLLSVEESEAYLRWLETGEGPCPWPNESRG